MHNRMTCQKAEYYVLSLQHGSGSPSNEILCPGFAIHQMRWGPTGVAIERGRSLFMHAVVQSTPVIFGQAVRWATSSLILMSRAVGDVFSRHGILKLFISDNGPQYWWWWWYHSLTAHQHQKGHTVPKQVIMIATSIQVATV